MVYPYAECGSCEVFGYCSGTEEEHEAYMKGFAWRDQPMAAECDDCDVQGYCARSDEECETYQAYRMGTGKETRKYERDLLSEHNWETRVNTANLGLVNRLSGKIVDIAEGNYMARVTIAAGDNVLTSMVPLKKLKQMGFQKGDQAYMAFKAVNVKLMW